MNDTAINKYFENASLKAAAATDEDMKLINCYTQKEFTAEQVFIFKLAICDNEIDRDIEHFSDSCLLELAKLFIGKTVISDHNPKSSNQTARIYNTSVEITDKLNKLNEPLKILVAKCYMARTKSNEDDILEIEAGIKKEVSVAASIGEVTCSVCNSNRRRTFCEHKKGTYYNGKLCFDNLSKAKDAYEVSFVAVPSQCNAGVIKAHTEDKDNEFLCSEKLELEKIKQKIHS